MDNWLFIGKRSRRLTYVFFITGNNESTIKSTETRVTRFTEINRITEITEINGELPKSTL
jgi:hypothetical protein